MEHNNLGKSILTDIVSLLKKKGYDVNVFLDIYENQSIPFFSEGRGEIMQITDKHNNSFLIDVNGNTKIYDPNGVIVYNNTSEYNDGLPFDIEKANDKDYLGLENKGYSIDESSWYSIYNMDNVGDDESICLNDEPQDIVEFIEGFINRR